MGTENACGSYFSVPQGEPGMTSYYQIDERGGPRSQQEEEMAPQNGANNEQVESELDLRQPQQQQQHEPQRQLANETSSRNHWSISQQIQNHLNNPGSAPSRLERSNSLASNWTFPNYPRVFNEHQYGIAIATTVQHPGTPQNQAHQQQQHIQPDGQLHHQQQNLHHQQHQQLQHHHHQQHHLTAMPVGMPQPSGGHQQLSKRFFYPATGKSSNNNKDICGDDKHKEDGDPWNVEAQAAFLGPNLWDKTLPYDSDLKVHQYADLDEFLSENGIPVDGLPSSHLAHSTSLNGRSDSLGHCAGLSLSGLSQVTTKRERSPSPSDCMSPDTINPPSPADSTFSMSSTTRDFDPRTRAFSDEELKPQPMIKKSRKQFVPDDMKDDKYWARRRKNNMAAKRSRDARRMKENQIALRANYLEKENLNLHREVEQLKQENMELRARLSKYQEV